MNFMDEDFLLKNKTAQRLYHTYAKDLPIIDYHCHIEPREIYEDRRFENITQVWLGGDHYKWRLIRSNGVAEDEITGNADDRLKFQRFAEALPAAIGNPMYHWTHLELKRYFGYDGILNGDTAEAVWTLCNEKLQQDDMTVRSLITRSNVQLIGTTDDPADSLEWHRKIAAENGCTAKVIPSFRPDKAVNIEKEGFGAYIQKLSNAAGFPIQSADDVKNALIQRLDYFCSLGCRATDHGLDYAVYAPCTDGEANRIFAKAMQGETLTELEVEQYKTWLLLHLGRAYAKRGIVMQLHCGVQRNTNTQMFRLLGPDTGFDCISVKDYGKALTGFLNALQQDSLLPKTILYSLNPADNELLDTVLGCFQGSEVPGKMQHGSAWWFSDTKSGMEAQLKSLANLSVLGNFIGMLTDSRSFLSYTRHEYFRRILCNLIGTWVENGEYPNDEKQLATLVQNICYDNAKRYFNL